MKPFWFLGWLWWTGVAALAAPSATSLRQAIADLAETYGPAYPAGREYLQRLDALGDTPDPMALAALQREALLSHPRLRGRPLLVLDRDPKPKSLPQNWQGNESLHRGPVSNRVAIIRDLATQPQLETLFESADSTLITDLDLHPDADRLLFSMVDAGKRWRIFEMDLGRVPVVEPRCLPLINEPDVDNYDACYLPDGGILFTSTATYNGVPCVGGNSHVANLYRYDPSSEKIRRLTFDQEHNWNPTPLPDGRVMYLRWEYSDLPHSNSRILFQMNPDGTNQSELYGSNSYFPNAFFYARPLPGHPSQVVGVVSGHHGVSRAGRLMILDPARSRREADGVVHEFPHRGRRVEAIVRDQLVKDVWPRFLMPWPLDEKHVLVSCQPDADSPWGIYLVDTFDNLTPILEVAGRGLFEPMVLAALPPPPIVPARVDLTEDHATVLLTDIYQGRGLEGVPRGTVRALRVLDYSFAMRDTGGLLGAIGMDGPWDIRRVLGTVPVEADGSAHFRIPAERPVMVQPLDEKGQALQTMRSWFTGMPGERISCIGCHADMSEAPSFQPPLAGARPPSDILAGWHAPVRGFGFEREVQPVLDRHCVSCHGPGGESPDLSPGRPITDWSSGISGHAGGDGGRFSASYAELQRYIRRPGIESDLRILSPMDFHFSTTGLGQLLRQGHHGVALDDEALDRLVTWADLNAPYHGSWGDLVGQKKVRERLDRARVLRRLHTVTSLPDYERQLDAPEDSSPPLKPKSMIEASPDRSRVRLVVEPAVVARRTLDLGEGVALRLVRVPGGRLHGQNIAPFWIGETEVTNAQFRSYDAEHDSRDESRHGYQFGRRGYDLNGNEQPAVRVSRQQAEAFAAWLGRRHGLAVALPDREHWEWACRAGTTTEFPWGDREDDYSEHANLGDRRLKEFAACTARDGYFRAEPLKNPSRYDDWIPRDDRFDDGALVSAEVGRYRPNRWGLHDMIGNVWEWIDAGPESEESVALGGSWYDRPARATVRARVVYQPYQRVFNVGFRIVIADAEEP